MLSAHPDPDFLLLQKTRHQYFDYRHRDFRVLDADLFGQNYTYSIAPQPTTVIGRSCLHLEVPRQGPFLGGHFEVDVDSATKLVLRWREFDNAGALLGQVEFESLDLSPDLGDMDLAQGYLDATPLDIFSNLTAQTGFEVLVPSLPPTGFSLVEATQLDLPDGSASWVRLLYSDGLERVWLLHSPVNQTLAATSPPGTVHVYSNEAWTVVSGKIDGYTVMSAGRVPQSQLLHMIKSLFN